MIAPLDNTSLFEHHNHIRIFNCRQPVSNDKHGPAFHQTIHSPLHNGFRSGVDAGCCFVQNQHRRICDGCSGNGQELPFSLGKTRTVSVQHRMIALRKPRDKIMRIGQLCRRFDFLICSIQLSIANIVCNGSGKQVGILKYDPQRAAKIRLLNLVDIDAVIPDFPVLDIIKPVNQVGDCRLACTSGSHKRHFLPRIGIHFDIVQHDLVIFVSKVHTVQHHIPFQFLISDRSFRLMGMFPGPDAGPFPGLLQCAVRLLRHIDQCDITVIDFLRLIQKIKDPLCTCQCHNNGIKLLRHLCNGHIKTSGQLQE